MKKLLILSALALTTGCQQANKPDLEAEIAALRKEAESYHAHGMASQFDMLKAHYASQATIMAPGLSTIQGQQAIGEFMDGFAQLKNFQATFSTPDVSVDPDGYTGYTTATATLRYNIADGRTETETIRDFHVWKKQEDGTWKITVDVWNETDPGVEGVYEYLPPLKGQSTVRNGTFVFLYGPSDAKGPLAGEAGTYTISGDTVKNILTYCSDPKRVGQSYMWRVTSSSGDTISYDVMNEKKVITGKGRAVRISF